MNDDLKLVIAKKPLSFTSKTFLWTHLRKIIFCVEKKYILLTVFFAWWTELPL